MAPWGGGPQAQSWKTSASPPDCHGPSGLAMTILRHILIKNFRDGTLVDVDMQHFTQRVKVLYPLQSVFISLLSPTLYVGIETFQDLIVGVLHCPEVDVEGQDSRHSHHGFQTLQQPQLFWLGSKLVCCLLDGLDQRITQARLVPLYVP